MIGRFVERNPILSLLILLILLLVVTSVAGCSGPMNPLHEADGYCPGFTEWREIESPFERKRCFSWGGAHGGFQCFNTAKLKLKPCADPYGVERAIDR